MAFMFDDPEVYLDNEYVNILTPDDIDFYDRWYKFMLDNRQSGKLSRLGEILQEADMQDKIRYECDSIKEMLIDKNESYGNSALDPVKVFSNVNATEQLQIQIDHKLSRIQKGTEYANEDTITDLIGYLVLLKIAQKEEL